MKKFGRQNLIFALSGSITLLILLLGTTTYLNAVNYAEIARGVDVYLVTDSQTTNVGDTFTADIFITNDKTPLNAMEAEVFFDSTLFEVSDFTFGTSLCEDRFILDTIIDNNFGRIHMSCGTITPFTGNATVFGTITATPLKQGVTNLTFGEKTHVHIHDGLGTEISRDTYSTAISIEAEV